VLIRKNFDPIWREWILKAVQGGRVAINLNGEIGQYFRSYKGLRQGPLSPLLFNLVADALSEILNCASEQGLINVLCLELVEGGLTHLQYADDIVMFLQYSEPDMINMKFLLFCYEKLSEMKINYSKSEVFTVGLSEQESRSVVNAFNCRLVEFPMKYLGLPLSDRIL